LKFVAAPVSLDSFATISVIGKGSYAKVLLVRKKDTNKLFALKILKKKLVYEKHQERHVIAEKEILSQMSTCPFLVKLFYSFQNDKKLFFVLEYCAGGELFNLIQLKGKLSEAQTRFYACQIVLAIEALHEKNIIYRDLKPENVLLGEDGYIKITDFGLSKTNVCKNDAKSICGTPEYLAPEVVLMRKYGKPVDWWTLGCIIYEMLTGLPPFYKKNRKALFEGIKGEDPAMPTHISTSAQSIIAELLNKNPDKRLGSDGAGQVKLHEWFGGVNWAFVLAKKYEAPYSVKVGNDLGIENFDKMFTAVDPDSLEVNEVHDRFTNFSWTFENNKNATQSEMPVIENGKMEVEE
jgi:serum/glucocorticoid-regulated kinase 2